MPYEEIEGRRRRFGGLVFLGLIILVILIGGRTIASYILDYQWWQELGQLSTWFNLILYAVAPAVGATLVAFAVFWIAHARGLKHAGTRLREHKQYAVLTTVAMFILAALTAAATIDTWAVVRYFGGRRLVADPSAWRDPIFGNPLAFYLFDLPFYGVLLRVILAISLIGALTYWLTARAWQLRFQAPRWGKEGVIDLSELKRLGSLESGFLRVVVAVFLVALAVRFYLDRYDLLFEDHGFMVGMEWVGQHVSLPLLWLAIAASLAAAVLFLFGRRLLALSMALVLPVQFVVPRIVAAVHVRPNEISIERPYIQRHIAATRSAFGLDRRVTETEVPAKQEAKIDFDKNKVLLDNVRLWDWRAFHDTVSQVQPLRPYTYADTDVDRYQIGGQLRQVLIAPRELDLSQLGDARTRWINPHFIFTHGYGLVLAEANRITANGLPVLFISDAPPVIKTPNLKLTRPEIYYGAVAHEPVFVRTAQPEFNYPSGSENVHTRYNGKGGFPISSVLMRAVASVAEGDWNILLTSYLTPESRMMIHRRIEDRLETLAGFVSWDSDPYLVITSEGHLVWIVDGYMTSDAHPYSRAISVEGLGRVNYVRNSIKATVDAYDGTVRLYVFDPSDPLVRAYQNLFPALFQPASQMPADLRAHTRSPELLFRAQADIYRTYHMTDPENFYNKADLWDYASYSTGQGGQPQPMAPTYLIATLPGQTSPEFLLMTAFTPHNKQNLIGLMMARCDGSHLGELVFLQIAKQEIIPGPLQIEARINQDQNISKDLTLWNQQGSQVLRGQLLVLPVDNTFLYVAPIYIQASEARMPQLKKVALAMGDVLVYADTYDEALQQLASALDNLGSTKTSQPAITTAAPGIPPPSGSQPGGADPRITEIRDHLRRYKELMAQGKWAEAGKEMDAIELLLRR